MIKKIRQTMVRLLAFGMLIPAGAWAQNRPPLAEQVAKTYGLDSFSQIDAIRYTFNIPGLKLSRKWEWEPKTGKVSYEGKDKEGKPVKVTYVRSQIESQPDNVKKDIDPAFRERSILAALPFSCHLGHRGQRGR